MTDQISEQNPYKDYVFELVIADDEKEYRQRFYARFGRFPCITTMQLKKAEDKNEVQDDRE